MATSLTTETDSSKLPVVIHNYRGISLSILQSLVGISQYEGVCAMSNEAIRKTTHEAPLMRPFAQ